MKLRNVVLSLGITGLLAPVTLIAADAIRPTTENATQPAAPAKPKRVASCENVSGTHIVPSQKSGCRSSVQPLRAYSKEDIERTGEINTAEALRKIDPIFR